MIFLQLAEALGPEEIALLESSGLANSGLLERAAGEVLAVGQADGQAEATILLSDDAQLRLLNCQYLGVDAPTDVLSFPAGEHDPDSQAFYLGDIVISVERAREQAAAAGHSLQDELQLLVVHGMLHLLGHDHAGEQEKAAMWALQAHILESLGCSITAPPG
jgi:probable rRNA maturation factor